MLKGGTCVIIIDNVIRKFPGNDFDHKENTGNNCYGIPPIKILSISICWPHFMRLRNIASFSLHT